MDYKIGVGVTSYKRPEHLKLWMEQYNKSEINAKLSVVENVTGIANAKNQCLNELKDCDYIFLFDDDCFPIKNGMCEYFISKHQQTENHHFIYLNHSHTLLSTKDGVKIYGNCGGSFMFLTKEVVDKVGFFYDKYDVYGFEHAGYTNRIHQAGLTPYGMYLCPEDSSDYICSLDLDSHSFHIKHKPSIKITEAIRSTEANKPIYLEDIKQVYRGII